MVEIQVLRGGVIVAQRAVGPTSLHVGRGPTNDLQLTDARVSTRHAVLWLEAGALRLEDLRSRNGTTVNGRAVEGIVDVPDGAVITVGNTKLQVVVRADELEALPLVLEDRTAGLRLPIVGDRLAIGSAAGSGLRLPGAARQGMLVLHPNGEIWLGTDDADVELAVDAPFEVGGHTLCLTVATEPGVTEAVETTRYPYRLDATLNGATGPVATVTDLLDGRAHTVTTDIRASLLYLLARKQQGDLASGVDESDRGWLPDHDVATGIWGRQATHQVPNNYHVLVCRVRKELAEAGFDAWFIEKKRKHIRARLDHAAVE